MRGSVLFAVALLLAGSTKVLAQAIQHLPAEQTDFSAEDETVKKPAAIPDEVLALLRQDSMVKDVLESEKIPLQKLPTSWFSASAIHLSAPGEPDMIVAAEGTLMEANVENFWVFRHTVHGYELVLNAPAHDLGVKKRRWNGMREIELESATATNVHTVLLRFDGSQYAVFNDKSKDIK
jgi:hypothetical protein